METGEKDKKQRNIWNFIDNVQGDKVVWMIVLLLMMMSVLVIFGSSSRLAQQAHTGRLDIIKEQAWAVMIGLGAILICYWWRWAKFIRIMSAAGFGISLVLLSIVFFHLDFGIIHAASINDSWRVLKIEKGPQIHIYEIVKVAMVMYVSWALDKAQGEGFTFIKWLQKRNLYIRRKDGSNVQAFEWLGKPFWSQLFYIYLPIIICVVMTAGGSNSSALFLAMLMMVTLVVGGISIKKVMIAVIALALLGGTFLLIYKAIGKDGRQVETLKSRFEIYSIEDYYQVKDKWRSAAAGSEEKRQLEKQLQSISKKSQQPISARIAIKEGGLLGKGPGGSTQQYVVPIMYGDYMYAFILEEYGAWGGFIVLILYLSMLARGSIIARNLDGRFEQIATGGLVLLISGQAFMHMIVNVGGGILPLTGQTLPLLSHGTTAFLMMSLAFGLILYFSRLAKENIAKREIQQAEAKEMENSLNDLDQLNNDLTDNEI